MINYDDLNTGLTSFIRANNYDIAKSAGGHIAFVHVWFWGRKSKAFHAIHSDPETAKLEAFDKALEEVLNFDINED
jgi:hypothetical protein